MSQFTITENEKEFFDNHIRDNIDNHLIINDDYDRDYYGISARVTRVIFHEYRERNIELVPSVCRKILDYYRETSDVFFMERF